MGNFYTNITTRNASAEEIVSFLKEMKLTAYVIMGPLDYCSIYEQSCDERDTRNIYRILRELSKRFSRPAIGFINHYDEALHYELWSNGKKIDEYCSRASIFDPEEESAKTVGGKPGVLALLLGSSGANEAIIEKILTATSDKNEAYASAIDRHKALVQAVGLPLHTVGYGFHSLSEGEIPEGIAPENILKT